METDHHVGVKCAIAARLAAWNRGRGSEGWHANDQAVALAKPRKLGVAERARVFAHLGSSFGYQFAPHSSGQLCNARSGTFELAVFLTLSVFICVTIGALTPRDRHTDRLIGR